MKFLKEYKIFESSHQSIIDEVSEILLELNDIGFNCEAFGGLKVGNSNMDEMPPGILRNIPDGYKLVKTHDFIYIRFSKSRPGFAYEDIIDVYYRIKEYLNMNGWIEEGDFGNSKMKGNNILYTGCKFKKPLDQNTIS